MARKQAFTPASLDALSSGRVEDPLTPGLALDVLPSGKKIWKYRRRVVGTAATVTLKFGLYPARSIAVAREWARGLNDKVEAGTDPRTAMRAEKARAAMTVERAHELYMVAVHEGRASRAKRPNKPRTIADKLEVYRRDIAPKLARKIIYGVTEVELIELVEAKGKVAKVRANRLAAELKVFFGWAASLRGLEIGLEVDPARRLGDLRFPETARSRKLDPEEIEYFLRAVAEEERDFRRGMLLWLLTAARISEVVRSRADEIVDGVWIIPSGRSKNGCPHRIALGPWGRRLMLTNSEWVFPAERVDGPRTSGWYKARDRVRDRMEKLAGHAIERFTPHDFRRTARSNTKRLKVDFETAEAMMNHVKKGLERTYDLYELEDEKRAWFLKWETEIIGIARRIGVADALEAPVKSLGRPRPATVTVSWSPQGARIEPRLHIGQLEPWAPPMLATPTSKLVLGGEAADPPLAKAINLSAR